MTNFEAPLRRNLYEVQEPQTVEERIEKERAEQQAKMSRRKALGMIGGAAAAIVVAGFGVYLGSRPNPEEVTVTIPPEKLYDDWTIDGKNPARIEKPQEAVGGAYGRYVADIISRKKYRVETLTNEESLGNPTYSLIRENDIYELDLQNPFSTALILISSSPSIVQFDYKTYGSPTRYLGYRSVDQPESELIIVPGDGQKRTGFLNAGLMGFRGVNSDSEEEITKSSYEYKRDMPSGIKISNLRLP